MLATCSGDRSIRIWRRRIEPPIAGDVSTATERWTCVSAIDDAHKRAIRSLAFSPSGATLATASFDAATAIWENIDREDAAECVATLEGHENEVKSVAWSASGGLLATCSRDKSVWIWEVVGDSDFECLSVLQEHTQDVKMVVWHPTEELLASASYDDTIKLWADDEDDWFCIATLEGHTSTVWAVDFDATGAMLASVSDDRSLKIWRRDADATAASSSLGSSLSRLRGRKTAKWTCAKTIPDLHGHAIYSVSWSKVNGMIATAGRDNRIRIFKLVSLASVGENLDFVEVAEIVNAHRHYDVNCVRWCPFPEHGNVLASAGDDGGGKNLENMTSTLSGVPSVLCTGRFIAPRSEYYTTSRETPPQGLTDE
ncbi:WD40-repeat-containing domain protein [Zopfochytrium polystomum]|nr:WD40-repeat-containing domain protein [Zopfochytrium polystomum]